MRLGGLAGALFGSNGPLDVFQFPPGKINHIINVPAGGAKLSFIIGDLPGTYGDNHGTCRVGVFKAQ